MLWEGGGFCVWTLMLYILSNGFRVEMLIFHQDTDRKGTMGMVALPQEKGLLIAS